MFYKDINKIVEKIKEDYKNSVDLSFRILEFNNDKLLLIFNQSTTDSEYINDFIIRPITMNKKKKKLNKFSLIYDVIEGSNIKDVLNYDDLYNYLGNGFCIVIYNSKSIAIEARSNLSRGINQPITEQTISGPKDAFSENYMTNVGLIRKRIKSNNLVLDEVIVGRETKTKIGIFYMDNIVEDNLLNYIKDKLNSIDIDGILDSSYIAQLISNSNSAFPTVENTERPDLVCMELLNGKISILIENSPYALIIPTFFIDLFHSPEDYYQIPKNVTFTRIIRLISFIIAVALPAFYIAITTYNHETIPITLIVNFASQSYGVPFPTIIEALGMTLVFEILRESDIRMPSNSGSAISILGAIVLGDAAVTAGIVSPIMVIVIATSSICSLMFSHVSMVNAIRLWKIIFMLFATFFGVLGVIMAMFLLVIELCSLNSFDKPYLYPVVPLNPKFLNDTFILKRFKKRQRRNPLLTDSNYKRSAL